MKIKHNHAKLGAKKKNHNVEENKDFKINRVENNREQAFCD